MIVNVTIEIKIPFNCVYEIHLRSSLLFVCKVERFLFIFLFRMYDGSTMYLF